MTLKEFINPVTPNRISYIDAIKGFAIFLVVLGHAIELNFAESHPTLAFTTIYSFHMPLFVFVSGYLSWGKIRVERLIKKKFLLLIVPFFAWALIFYCTSTLNIDLGIVLGRDASEGLPSYIIAVVKNPSNSLWFFWTLFWIFCISALLKRLSSTDLIWVLGIVVLGLSPVIFQFDNGMAGFSRIQWLFPFFVMGYLLAKHKDKLKRFFMPVQVASVIFFPVLVTSWELQYRFGFFQTVIINLFGPQRLLAAFYFVYIFLVPILGIALTSFFIKIISGSHIFVFFVWLGKFTLEIYAIHFLFININAGSGILGTIFAAAISLFASLVIIFLIKRQQDSFKLVKVFSGFRG